MTQETPQRTTSRSWLVIVATIIAAVVLSLVLAFCPKPKPVPADTSAPSPTISADGPEQKDEGKGGKITG